MYCRCWPLCFRWPWWWTMPLWWQRIWIHPSETLRQAGIEELETDFLCCYFNHNYLCCRFFFPIVFSRRGWQVAFSANSVLWFRSGLSRLLQHWLLHLCWHQNCWKETEHHNWIYRKTRAFFHGMNNFTIKHFNRLFVSKSATFPIIGLPLF